MRKLSRGTAKVLGLLFLATGLGAQERTDPERVLVRAARMLDVAAGRIVTDAGIVIEGDRIVAVNPGSPPRGARVIDLGDMT